MDKEEKKDRETGQIIRLSKYASFSDGNPSGPANKKIVLSPKKPRTFAFSQKLHIRFAIISIFVYRKVTICW